MTGQTNETFEAWTILAGLSQVTETMRLGTLVTCITHRYPAVLAKLVATLDVMSNGRVDLGIGAGWNRKEQSAYGLPWADLPKARIARLVETIKILRGMWTNDSFTFAGKYYSVKDAVCLPKPTQKPSPPIIIGGKGEQLLLKAVAKYADGWNIDEVPPDGYAHKLEVIRDHCKAVGTNYGRIEKTLETYLLISDKPEHQQRLLDWTTRGGRNAATMDEIKRDYVMGSVEEVTEKFAEYIKVGVQRFQIYFMDYPTLNSILPLAKEVMPSLG
jgi:alkanesulfonate monooxygenase SsuD/methylene tetrahydromethanopterin reductase-like flavin-dependent oxidoreductase (luciferase family)